MQTSDQTPDGQDTPTQVEGVEVNAKGRRYRPRGQFWRNVKDLAYNAVSVAGDLAEGDIQPLKSGAIAAAGIAVHLADDAIVQPLGTGLKAARDVQKAAYGTVRAIAEGDGMEAGVQAASLAEKVTSVSIAGIRVTNIADSMVFEAARDTYQWARGSDKAPRHFGKVSQIYPSDIQQAASVLESECIPAPSSTIEGLVPTAQINATGMVWAPAEQGDKTPSTAPTAKADQRYTGR